MNINKNINGWNLEYSATGRSFSESFKEKIISNLQQGMPAYDVYQYFGNQPNIFEAYDHLVVSQDPDTDKVIGIIGAKNFPVGSSSFLYVWTAMIVDAYRGTTLLKKINQFLFENVIRENGVPSLIVAKTYNPVVYNMFRGMASRIPAADVYPDLRLETQRTDMSALALEIVNALSKELILDVDTGVIPGAQRSVAPDFFPKMDMSSDERTNSHFIKHITDSDQLLCFVRLQPSSEVFVRNKIIR